MAEQPLPESDRAERRRRLVTQDDGVPGFNYRAIACVEHRVMCMAINKNACTSLKWMMAGLCGEDAASFTPLLQPYVSMEDSIHNRRLWKRTPRLLELDPDVRASMAPDGGWFVFAVVRDPRVRLFSAWQNKFLLDNPEYARFRRNDWYPRHPVSATTIVDDFRRFVDMLGRNSEHELLVEDGHFRRQTEMLMLDTFEYSHLYDIAEIGRLRADLTAHLAGRGWTGELFLPRLNDTPLRPRAELFDAGVTEVIGELYRVDFETLGARWDPTALADEPEWSAAALREVELRAAFGRRLADLLTRATRLRGRLLDAEQQLAALQQRFDEGSSATEPGSPA